ncbi:MAG: hypothetical protein QOJ52_1180 [Acidimicrobiaceae bacterium]|nr:hypothetical protein [Acidimicrobiaceae bacterium]MDQ1419218.1 hypothetical protein [Acidimicrobiaceae bacterium]MDQ1440530.1 hypothetical protein [Acidimicrobiaceae bacterium]
MSTLWTPEGERPIRRDPAPAGGPAQPGPPGAGQPPEGPGGEELTAEDEAAMAELQEQLARTPVELVIANHAFGLFELAALHLSLQPPQLPQARLAIDALGALVEGLAGRLGEYERQLVEGLANLRMAYVQIRGAAQGEAPGSAPASEYPGPNSP